MRTRGDQIRRAKALVIDQGPEMLRRYEAGEMLREIAVDYEVTEATVARAVRLHGGNVRKRGFGSDPSRFTGPANPAWKGGFFITEEGYRKIRLQPDDQYFSMASRGYVLEHRLVMAKMVKRPLLSTETVHHIDGDKLNNDQGNLQLRLGRHGKGVHVRCHDCGSQNVGPVEL